MIIDKTLLTKYRQNTFDELAVQSNCPSDLAMKCPHESVDLNRQVNASIFIHVCICVYRHLHYFAISIGVGGYYF